MINISIVNKSTVFKDADLPTVCNGLQIQLTRDFYPIWGFNAKIWYTPLGANPTADHWALFILDNATQAGELGVHDVTPAGLPLGQAFAETAIADGSSIERTLSHELGEMGADPHVNLTAQVGSILYAYEPFDAPEADAYGYDITIPDGWTGAGTKVLVSDFVTPNWFQPGSTGPFDFMNHITAPLQLLPGGYIGFLDLNNLNAGWQQSTMRTEADARMRARPHIGSRRALRAIPQDQRIRSTYAPGTDAIPAQKEAA